jgi:hypothetical protein
VGFLVQPQNQGRQFVSGLASKRLRRFVSGLASKALGIFVSGLASKPLDELGDLGLIITVTVSPGLAS